MTSPVSRTGTSPCPPGRCPPFPPRTNACQGRSGGLAPLLGPREDLILRRGPRHLDQRDLPGLLNPREVQPQLVPEPAQLLAPDHGGPDGDVPVQPPDAELHRVALSRAAHALARDAASVHGQVADLPEAARDHLDAHARAAARVVHLRPLDWRQPEPDPHDPFDRRSGTNGSPPPAAPGDNPVRETLQTAGPATARA